MGRGARHLGRNLSLRLLRNLLVDTFASTGWEEVKSKQRIDQYLHNVIGHCLLVCDDVEVLNFVSWCATSANFILLEGTLR